MDDWLLLEMAIQDHCAVIAARTATPLLVDASCSSMTSRGPGGFMIDKGVEMTRALCRSPDAPNLSGPAEGFTREKTR